MATGTITRNDIKTVEADGGSHQISAYSEYTGDATYSLPTGYKAVVATLRATGHGSAYLRNCFLNGDGKVRFTVASRESSAITAHPYFDVVVAKL